MQCGAALVHARFDIIIQFFTVFAFGRDVTLVRDAIGGDVLGARRALRDDASRINHDDKRETTYLSRFRGDETRAGVDSKNTFEVRCHSSVALGASRLWRHRRVLTNGRGEE